MNFSGLAWVVQKVDNAIHQINHYHADSVVCFVNTYPSWLAIYLAGSIIQPLNNWGLLWRHGGIMVDVLNSSLGSVGWTPDQGHCVMFLVSMRAWM